MQSGLRWGRSHSRRRFPVVGTPLCLSWHLGIGQALRAVCWSVACGQSWGVCPPHPYASQLRGISPARWSARPPPRGGSLSPLRAGEPEDEISRSPRRLESGKPQVLRAPILRRLRAGGTSGDSDALGQWLGERQTERRLRQAVSSINGCGGTGMPNKRSFYAPSLCPILDACD